MSSKHVGIDLQKLVDNHTKVYVFSVNAHTRGNPFFLELYLDVPSYLRHRTAQYKTHSNRTPTGASKAYSMRQVWHHQYMYMSEHSRHGILWQLSACINSVYQVLFLLPLPLLHTWQWGLGKILNHNLNTSINFILMSWCNNPLASTTLQYLAVRQSMASVHRPVHSKITQVC